MEHAHHRQDNHPCRGGRRRSHDQGAGPAATIALDAAAGYFAAAYFGWPVGATVAAIGCFIANALGGFASWLPMLPIYPPQWPSP